MGLAFGLSSCDKIFDNLEGDLSKMTDADMLGTDAGLQHVLAELYSYMPMSAFSTNDQSTLFANASRGTPAYSNAGISSFWDYTAMRNINKFISDLDGALANKVIDQAKYNAYKGEALAIRAYCYFASVRVYGGIPIVEEVLDDKYDGGENAGLYFPRKTEKESWDWVIDQFQQAADLLPETQDRAMAINKYTALGLKARAALWAASVSKYWERAALNSSWVAVSKKLTYMDKADANAYYKIASDAAAAVINSGKYSLAGGTNPGSIATAVTNLETLFQKWDGSEGLLGRNYADGNSTSGNPTHDWSANQFVSGYLVGTYSVTLNLADEYDYYVSETDRSSKDGKIATKVDGNENYVLNAPEDNFKTIAQAAEYKQYNSPADPFKLKDARFQAWVLYPGATFRGVTTNIQGGMVIPDAIEDEKGNVLFGAGAHVYPVGNPEYKLGDNIYYAYGAESVNTSSFWNLILDKNANNRSWYSFMIKKFVDPAALNKATETPWYDLRYAEILLTYAEAYAEGGVGDAATAKKALNDIRKRAGFTDEVEANIDNVLHEWKVEFAFENQWPSVLYRRRAYLNPERSNTQEEGTIYQKHTLIPMVDLTGAAPKYIFLRAIPYSGTSKWENYNGTLQVRNDSYYSSIPSFNANRIEDNNK